VKDLTLGLDNRLPLRYIPVADLIKTNKGWIMKGASSIMGEGKVFTDGNFQNEVLQSAQPVIVDFWAEWCGPCKMLAPVIDRIAKANAGKITVGKLNVDDNPSSAQRFGIQGIPTLLFFKGGSEVERLVGFQSEENIQGVIDEVLG
jgi:thioredoxin 1